MVPVSCVLFVFVLCHAFLSTRPAPSNLIILTPALSVSNSCFFSCVCLTLCSLFVSCPSPPPPSASSPSLCGGGRGRGLGLGAGALLSPPPPSLWWRLPGRGGGTPVSRFARPPPLRLSHTLKPSWLPATPLTRGARSRGFLERWRRYV